MIRWMVVAAMLLLGAVQAATADVRDVYTVRGIDVNEQAASLIEARERAMAAARVSAARTMINRITLPRDRSAAGGVPMDSALASRLTAAVDVEEEVAGAGRYRGKLSVVLNPQMVRAHLNSLGIPYLDTQAPLALLVPVAADGATADMWQRVFPERSSGALVPYVRSAAFGHTAFTPWSDLSGEALSQGARRAIIADLQGRPGAWRVILSAVTAGGSEPLGATPPAATMEQAMASVSLLLDEGWKEASIIRDSARTEVNAAVRYTSLAEWNTLRSALVRSPLVSDLRTRAVARDGALITFAYAGDEARLRRDLAQRGVAITREADGALALRSAASFTGLQ
ncbi:hypothetical protein [Hyphomonas sp.]|uniref:hypothetical protein n=1 Tax=Hyphomonas sp. TaxID=87 RepID=UPI00391A916E